MDLESDRTFILSVIDAALTKKGWERLSYEPREESLFECLHQFRSMVVEFVSDHICDDEYKVWMGIDRTTEFKLCPRHEVYEHDPGCPVCHDS